MLPVFSQIFLPVLAQGLRHDVLYGVDMASDLAYHIICLAALLVLEPVKEIKPVLLLHGVDVLGDKLLAEFCISWEDGRAGLAKENVDNRRGIAVCGIHGLEGLAVERAEYLVERCGRVAADLAAEDKGLDASEHPDEVILVHAALIKIAQERHQVRVGDGHLEDIEA